jgi:hypothetical protein
LFIEPYLQKGTHEDVELYVRILLASVSLAKEKYGVATLIPYIPADGYLLRTIVVDVSLAKDEAAGAKLRIESEGHPMLLANRLRASLLEEYIENRVPGCGSALTGAKLRQSDSKAFLIIAGERRVLFVFGKNAVSGRERLVPGPTKQAKARLRPASLIRGFMTDWILLERPQVDTIRMALIDRWRVDGRMVVSVVCAAFQAIAEHARSDRADDEG